MNLLDETMEVMYKSLVNVPVSSLLISLSSPRLLNLRKLSGTEPFNRSLHSMTDHLSQAYTLCT